MENQTQPTAQPAQPPQQPPQQPTPQPAAAQTPPPLAAQGQKPALNLDPRTKLTIQWSAIWYAVGSVIEFILGYISIYFIGGMGEFLGAFGGFFKFFPFGVLIREIIIGAIIGAIAGFLISKFYPYLQKWNVQYLKGKLDTFFKLLFYPSLAGAIIGFLLSSAGSFVLGIMPVIIIFAGSVLGSFVYAKMLTKKVGAQYPAPNLASGMPAPAAPAAAPAAAQAPAPAATPTPAAPVAQQPQQTPPAPPAPPTPQPPQV